MGRRAEIFKVYFKRGWAYVRFTHEKQRFAIALGTRDRGEATEAAAREYNKVVADRRRSVAGRPRMVMPVTPRLVALLRELANELEKGLKQAAEIASPPPSNSPDVPDSSIEVDDGS